MTFPEDAPSRMKPLTPSRNPVGVVAGLCVVLAACGGSPAASSTPSTTYPASEAIGEPIVLEESVPDFASLPDGGYKLVASTIGRGEVDGITALSALFWIYPPKGIELEPGVPNPQTVADGANVLVGSCTYRFDIDEEKLLVTLVPIEEASPGGCGAG